MSQHNVVDHLAVVLRTTPTTRALMQVLAVLHGKNAEVLELTWRLIEDELPFGEVSLIAKPSPERYGQLQSALERIVDVTDLRVISAPRGAEVDDVPQPGARRV